MINWKFLNNCNSLDIIRNNKEDIFKINSEYFTIKQFLSLGLNELPLIVVDVNSTSLNKSVGDLHNFCSMSDKWRVISLVK